MKTKERLHQYDVAYMKMAIAMSELSRANRRKVGAIIVSKEDQVISQGFNGTPKGFDNVCEDVICNCTCCEKNGEMSVENCIGCPFCTLKTKKEVLHAETNAISKCAKYISSTNGATLYVTLSPCIDCAKMIIQSDIARVVYLDEYRETEGIDFLKECGIIVEHLKINE